MIAFRNVLRGIDQALRPVCRLAAKHRYAPGLLQTSIPGMIFHHIAESDRKWVVFAID